jgi:hypothetical protein
VSGPLLAGSRAALQLFHNLVYAEASGFLARREFPERLKRLANDLLRGHTDEGMVEPPVVIRVRRDVKRHAETALGAYRDSGAIFCLRQHAKPSDWAAVSKSQA